MTHARRVAFYAPMKSPQSPVPSGDRTVARLYMQALADAGFTVDLASEMRCYDGAGDASVQTALQSEAAAEIERITALWQARPEALPAFWFTYHVYHKAPDLIGPALSAQFGIPYVIAEPSHAPKRARGDWAAFHDASSVAIKAASLVLLATERDGQCVRALRGEAPTLLIPPFVDCADWPVPAVPDPGGIRRMITVAMMRGGDKAASYQCLAAAMKTLPARGLSLTIVGDGEARAEIEAMFAGCPHPVEWAGMISDRRALLNLLGAHDLFVWPAVNEAYGLALLEAQGMGLPVVAGREGGVAEVVRDGETGVLTAPRDPAAFAEAIQSLIESPAHAATFAAAAARFVRGERSLQGAVAQLREGLRGIGIAP